MSFLDLEFYLVFLGISALLVGAIELSGISMPMWMQWIVFAALAVGSLVVFRQRVYKKLRPPPEDAVQQGVDGDRATAVDAIEPGTTGAMMLRGARWTGINRDSRTIAAGSACRVEPSEGLTLDLRLDY